MTSISVNNAAKSLQNMQKAKNLFDSHMTGKNFQEDNSFQNAIDMYKKPMDIRMANKVKSSVSSSVENNQQYAQKGAAKDCVKENGMDKVKKEKTFSEDEINAVDDAAKKIVSQVAKELNVSEEDVKEALENLGISVFELSNVNQMVALFTEVLGISDGMQIVTDGDLFASLTSLTQSIDDVIQSLQAEMQISVEDLLVQMQDQGAETSEVNDELTTIGSAYGVGSEDSTNEVISQITIPVEKIESEEKSSTIVSSSDGVQSNENVVVNETLGEEMAQHSNSDELLNKESENGESKQNLNQNTFSVFNEVNQNDMVDGVETQSISYSTFNDIMDQIGDYVRTNVTSDVKQMEIQLSPANLGQVHINIASKNGVVTAQITAESEMVKSAIESQVIQLKERLEGQGVKIEAVEVTVASHEFERNLDQNNENRETQEEAKKVASRKWNLSDLDGEIFDEELTDSEQVELDMMKLTGNQLNYMV